MFILIILLLFSIQTFSSANENLSSVDNLFHIDQMNSHNEKTDIVKLPTLALEREKEMNAPL